MSENLSSVASAMEESSTNVNMVATIDIKSLIDDVQNTSKLTEGGITEISTVITNVSKIVSTIASAVEEQTAATQEIANNINQASHGIQNANESVNLGSVVATDISKDISEVQEQHIVFLKAVMMWSKVPLIYWVVFKSLTPGS